MKARYIFYLAININVPFTTFKTISKAVLCKVTIKRKYIIALGDIAYILVRYVNLL